MKKFNSILIIISLVIVIVTTLKIADWHYSKKIEKYEIALRSEKIKTNKLVKEKDGLYTKLVADTLTISKLNKLNDSLKLKLKNPKVVEVIKWKYRDQEKPIDSIEVKDSLVSITDYYPNKQNRVITYTGIVNRYLGTGTGTFSFTSQEFRLGIGQNKDGTYSVNTRVPDYFNITEVNVQSLPMDSIKKDNFGWIVGFRVGQNYLNTSKYLKLNSGIRYKKIYLMVGASLNGAVEGGLDMEF